MLAGYYQKPKKSLKKKARGRYQDLFQKEKN